MQETFDSPGPPLPLTSLWHRSSLAVSGMTKTMAANTAWVWARLQNVWNLSSRELKEGPASRGAELLCTTHDQSPGVIFPDISAKPSREI